MFEPIFFSIVNTVFVVALVVSTVKHSRTLRQMRRQGHQFSIIAFGEFRYIHVRLKHASQAREVRQLKDWRRQLIRSYAWGTVACVVVITVFATFAVRHGGQF